MPSPKIEMNSISRFVFLDNELFSWPGVQI